MRSVVCAGMSDDPTAVTTRTQHPDLTPQPGRLDEPHDRSSAPSPVRRSSVGDSPNIATPMALAA